VLTKSRLTTHYSRALDAREITSRALVPNFRRSSDHVKRSEQIRFPHLQFSFEQQPRKTLQDIRNGCACGAAPTHQWQRPLDLSPLANAGTDLHPGRWCCHPRSLIWEEHFSSDHRHRVSAHPHPVRLAPLARDERAVEHRPSHRQLPRTLRCRQALAPFPVPRDAEARPVGAPTATPAAVARPGLGVRTAPQPSRQAPRGRCVSRGRMVTPVPKRDRAA
jgi:hypothetical protein